MRINTTTYIINNIIKIIILEKILGISKLSNIGCENNRYSICHSERKIKLNLKMLLEERANVKDCTLIWWKFLGFLGAFFKKPLSDKSKFEQ